MSIEFNTPFTDRFFQVERQVLYFTLGGDPASLFEHFKELDLSRSDCCRLSEATNIDVRNSQWSIGRFSEPTVLCRQLYPKGTVVVIQGKKPGSRIALFSTVDSDERQPDTPKDGFRTSFESASL